MVRAERWIGSRQRWSGIRARPNQSPPEPDRTLDPRIGVVDVGRRQRGRGPTTARSRPCRPVRACAGHERGCPRYRATRSDCRRRVRPSDGRIGGAVAAVDDRPFGGCAAVVEGRFADQVDLHAPVDAFDGPDEHVFGVVVGWWPGVRCDQVVAVARSHRERVAHDDPSGGSLPRGDEHVRARLVSTCGGMTDVERAEAEEPGFAVEEAAEDALGVEGGDAEPVDRAVGGDQGAGVAVGDEGVGVDRGERRGRGGALRLTGRCAHWVIQGSRQRPWPATSCDAASGPQEPGT